MTAFWEAIRRPGGAVGRGPRRWYVEVHPQAISGFVDLVTHPWVVEVSRAILGDDMLGPAEISQSFAISPAQEPAKPEAAKPEAPKVAKKPNPRRQQDARHCLEKSTNTEIIKCAEAYL